MACGTQREAAVSGLSPDDCGGVAVAYDYAQGGDLRFVGECGWLASQASRQVHKSQHVDCDADCIVLGCGLSTSVCRGWGGVHVADNEGGGKHGHTAVCLDQGFEKGFCFVTAEDGGVDGFQIPSLPDDFVDAQSPRDAELVDEVDVDARRAI